MTAVGIAFALGWSVAVPLAASAQGTGDPSQNIRRGQHMCYEPTARLACKQACAEERERCSAGPACAVRSASCVKSCPPKLCSRGG